MSRTATGRPVRFFIILMGGWIFIRLASAASGWFHPLEKDPSSPLAQLQSPPARPVPAPQTAVAAEQSVAMTTFPESAGQSPTPTLFVPILKVADRAPHSVRSAAPSPMERAFAAHSLLEAPRPIEADVAQVTPPTAAPAVPLAPSGQPSGDRWRGSAWLLWREGSSSPANIVTAGRLGGSQAGLRIDYDLTPPSPGRTAAYARVSTALNHPASPEGAVGVAWQPSRAVALSIAAERRIALGKGARNANALLAVGGFGPAPVLLGLEAEAYAQAGVVGFHRGDLFADGKFSLFSPIARSPLRLGASVSGGAQPGVERLDVGPEVQVRLPLPRLATRLSVEWRERIAGQALPSSGLAVTLGADF